MRNTRGCACAACWANDAGVTASAAAPVAARAVRERKARRSVVFVFDMAEALVGESFRC